LAEGIARLLTSEDVPEKAIILETRSKSTSENARYVREILDQRFSNVGRLRVAIVTSDYHCRRARAAFARFGLHVRVVPVPDVAKRAGSRLYRLQGFFTIATEMSKDLAY
jgi:uncharacterized SAM-binding protein YcdF (DUF218 family)